MKRKNAVRLVIGALLLCALVIGMTSMAHWTITAFTPFYVSARNFVVNDVAPILFFFLFFEFIYQMGAIEVRAEEKKKVRAETTRRTLREIETAERDEEMRHQMGYCKTCNPRVSREQFVILAEWKVKEANMTLARYAS